uniref:MFS transporter n=1 Tax=Archaeoglobus fulgidus TaxID=2234 RepID=A0A7J2TI73_ARCFL
MLLIIELILGILCGIFLSLYVPSMVKIGIAEIYGYLALLTSISTILAYLATGISLDRGYRFPVVSLAFLGLAIFFLENSMLVIAALIFGAYIGAHYVALLYIASSRTKDLILAHSIGFLGMSLGAMIVLFEAYNPLISILSLIALGYYRLLKPAKIEKIEKPMSKREVCLIFSILGLAIGLSTMNVDYYLAMKFEAEREIAMLFAVASFFSSLATLLSAKLVGQIDSFKLHITSTALQAVIYGLIGFTPALILAIFLVALADSALILSDSSLENIFTTGQKQKGSVIAIAGISWEISAGIGRLLGALIFSLTPEAPFLLSMTLLFLYTAFWASKLFKFSKALEPCSSQS